VCRCPFGDINNLNKVANILNFIQVQDDINTDCTSFLDRNTQPSGQRIHHAYKEPWQHL